jgi:hypothetical protein
LNLELERPRDPTHPVVVEAMHRILTVLGLEQDSEKSTESDESIESVESVEAGKSV